MNLPINAIRFALIPPATIFAWLLVAIIGIYFDNRILPIFCPAGFGSGKDCYAPYWPDVQFAGRLIFVGLSAIAVVSISFTMAPTRKLLTGTIAYVVGAGVATLFAVEAGWGYWLSAILAGLLPLWLQRHVAGGDRRK